MSAIISSQSNLIGLIKGAQITLWSPETGHRQTAPLAAARHIFNGCGDARIVQGRERQIEIEWKHTRSIDLALRLLLIGISPEEPNDLRLESADLCDAHLKQPSVQQVLRNTLFAAPFPDVAPVQWLLAERQHLPHLSQLLKDALGEQQSITKVRLAWDAIHADSFVDAHQRAAMMECAIEIGLFYRFVTNSASPSALKFEVLKARQSMRAHENGEQIVTEWARGFAGQPAAVTKYDHDKVEESEDIRSTVHSDAVSSFERFNRVRQQIGTIVGWLRANDMRRVSRFVRELIDGQIAHGDNEYAAKSLCLLAQEAKKLGVQSLQLEWSLEATLVNPTDAWAHGQAADALIEYFRLEEALQHLSLMEMHGDPADKFFAATTRARIAKVSNDLDGALSQYLNALRDFSGIKDEHFGWAGAAETYRAMHRYEEALATYTSGLERHPEATALRCGRAAVLSDVGRLAEALSEYQIAKGWDTDDVASNGHASVLKRMGRLNDSLQAYDDLIAEFPLQSVGYCGRADVLLSMGRTKEAMLAYQYAIDQFPHIPVAYHGRAECLRELGRFEEALASYADARARFPTESRIATGRAQLLKLMGKWADSLAAYDEAVSLFPYDLYAKVGRGDLLKRLGRVDEALAVYTEIWRLWPLHYGARNAKAALLLTMDRIDDAEALLPVDWPETQDDWVAYRIRGNILAKRGDLQRSIQHFRLGVEKVPFGRELRLMRRALDSLRLHRGDRPTPQANISLDPEPISNVIQLHLVAASGDKMQARRFLREMNGPRFDPLAELRDAVAAAYGVAAASSKKTRDWILARELDAISLEAA